MTIYGYLRTSKQQVDGQAGMDPDSQTRALEAVGVAPSDVYRDLGLSGTTASTSRAGWRVLQDRLRPGDTVVVVELARIGRRWTEAVNTIRQLRGEGVRFRSLAEGESTWARYLEADEDQPGSLRRRAPAAGGGVGSRSGARGDTPGARRPV